MVAWIALTVLVTFVLSELIGYAVHWSAHHRWAGRLWKAHMVHHRLYVPSYETPTYLNTKWDNFALWLAAPAMVLVALVSVFLPWWIGLTAFVSVVINAIVSTAVHEAFHVPTHWARKLPWFKQANRWHKVHHLNVRSNLGINQYLYDRIFGTFRSKRWIRR